MPFLRPTLTDLRTSVRASIAAALPGSDALLRYSNLGIIGDILAKLTNAMFGYLDYIARQSVPFTSTDEYLEGWSALKGISRKPATIAKGSLTFVGTNGSLIPAGTPLTRADGMAFVTTADATVTGGTAVVPVAAALPGAAGNAAVGVAMTLGSGVAGVQSTGLATVALTGGSDIEADDAFRGRMLQAYSSPPQGGALTDYVTWALAVPSVTRCWVTPGTGAGTVSVLFMVDVAEAAKGGFPQGTNGVAARDRRGVAATGDQLAVAEYIYDLQPVTALVYVAAPTMNTIGLTITGLSAAGKAVQAAVSAAVVAALRANAVPGGTTNISAIEAAIATVPGSAGFVLTSVTADFGAVTGGVAGNIVSNAGALPVLGGIVFA